MSFKKGKLFFSSHEREEHFPLQPFIGKTDFMFRKGEKQ